MSLVKRLETGYFTIATVDQAMNRESLCGKCGNQECPINLILHRLEVNKYNALVEVRTCKSFVPVIDFRDTAGTDRRFNTFRVGTAWHKRVQPGDVVALNGPTGIYGTAKVTSSHSGSFVDMKERYGSDNHLSINAEIEGVDFDLEAVMRKNYGPQRFNRSSNVSVIYLERLRV